MSFETFTVRSLNVGDPTTLSDWMNETGFGKIAWSMAVITGGVGLYGLTVGAWHSPRLALYVGIKLPLIIFVTLALNGMINGMLARNEAG